MWVLHEPGACTNKDGPNNKKGEDKPPKDNDKQIDDASVKALQAILKQAQPGDDVSAAIMAMLN